jgi:hypothetical protein
VTAEHKVNRYGSRYVYYHCTHNRPTSCRQPSIELRALEQQIQAVLKSLTLPAGIFDAFLDGVTDPAKSKAEIRAAQRASLSASLTDVDRQLRVLLDLRLRDLIDDAELQRRQQSLQRQRLKFSEALGAPVDENPIEPLADVVTLMNKAIFLFSRGDDATKRLLFETVASNPLLTSKKLSVQAALPFRLTPDFENRLAMCAWRDEIRTFVESAAHDETAAERLKKIRTLAAMARELEAKESPTSPMAT